MTGIIVIDDNQSNREVARVLLEELGATVVDSDNVTEALGFVASGEHELVLLDWMMPDIDGIEFLELLRESVEGKKIKVVMCTAKAGAAEKQEALDAGADGYLVKPITLASLKAELEAVGTVF